MNKFEQEKLQYMSNVIRGLSIDAVEKQTLVIQECRLECQM